MPHPWFVASHSPQPFPQGAEDVVGLPEAPPRNSDAKGLSCGRVGFNNTRNKRRFPPDSFTRSSEKRVMNPCGSVSIFLAGETDEPADGDHFLPRRTRIAGTTGPSELEVSPLAGCTFWRRWPNRHRQCLRLRRRQNPISHLNRCVRVCPIAFRPRSTFKDDVGIGADVAVPRCRSLRSAEL